MAEWTLILTNPGLRPCWGFTGRLDPPIPAPSALKKILFVCTGNTCRSPMAEMMFRDLVQGRSDYEVASAGVGAIPGQPASKPTTDLLKAKGIDSSRFRSQPLTFALMQDVTHVFAMSRQHLRVIEHEFPEMMEKAYLVTEFSPDDDLRGADVADPIGMGVAAYRLTHPMLDGSLPSVLAYVDQTWERTTGSK